MHTGRIVAKSNNYHQRIPPLRNLTTNIKKSACQLLHRKLIISIKLTTNNCSDLARLGWFSRSLFGCRQCLIDYLGV